VRVFVTGAGIGFLLSVLPIDAGAQTTVPGQGDGVDEDAPSRCDFGTAHPTAPAEFSEFGFLIGDFQVTAHARSADGWTPPRPGPRARWNGRYGLGGMIIYDEWFDPDPRQDPNAPRGVNVRFYDPEAAQWKMMWLATGAAQVADLRAEMRDGKLTMWQVYPERPGFLADFTVEDDDHWHRVSYTKDSQGEWVPQFKLAATRIPCG